jgi:hypothetical protein
MKNGFVLCQISLGYGNAQFASLSQATFKFVMYKFKLYMISSVVRKNQYNCHSEISACLCRHWKCIMHDLNQFKNLHEIISFINFQHTGNKQFLQ